MATLDDFGTVEALVYLAGLIGGANWFFADSLGTNLVTELVGSGTASLVYLVVGVAALLALVDLFDIVNVEEVIDV